MVFKRRNIRSGAVLLFSVWLAGACPGGAEACTNLIVTRGASSDGSVMITYAADSHTRYGAVAYTPAAFHNPGDLCEVYHYENGRFLGTIPEAGYTRGVVQFMNDRQVAVGETTFGGLDSLVSQPGSFPDYGSLMKIGLQRASTARELIRVMTTLAEEYGYGSSGESFSVSDAREAWIFEMIGKGRYEKGAVWVALRVPDGYVSGHANQARITTFPLRKRNNWDDPAETVFHAPDVISFARTCGFFRGTDETFSFSDVYNPVGFGGARYCDARVWSFFRKINAEVRENEDYTRYAQGLFDRNPTFPGGLPNPNGFVTNRLPLWVKPDAPVTMEEVRAAMRDHYEDTPLDMRRDPGAGPFGLPYRWRPMEFEVDGVRYLNERAVATQQTGYSFVAQSRSWLPDPVGGIFWFGVDDAASTVYLPLYCGITRIPDSYATGNGSMITWSETSAFWTFNQVSNWSYTRYDSIHPEIRVYRDSLERQFGEETALVDLQASDLYRQDPDRAVTLVTAYSVLAGNKLAGQWKDFYHYLFMKYMDGNQKVSEGHRLKDNGNGKNIPARPLHPGYGDDWEKIMIRGTGDRLRVEPGE